MLIIMSQSFWIVTYLLMSHILVKLLLGILVLVSILPLYWKYISLIVFQCQTGINPIYHCHIFTLNKNILLES